MLRPDRPFEVVIDGEHRFVGLFTGAALHEPVLDTPVVGRRVLAAIHLAGVPLASYSGQRMLEVLAHLPREELFWATPEDLHETAVGVLTLAQGRRLRLSLRREPYGRFFSCLVHLPQDRYSVPARTAMGRVLLRELDGWRVDHTVTVGEPGPVLVHFTVQVDPAVALEPDPGRLRGQLAAAILTWDDWVLDAAGADAEGIAEHLAGLPQGYKDDVDPVRALADLRRIRELRDEPHLELVDDADELHFRLLLAGAGVSLSAVLPARCTAWAPRCSTSARTRSSDRTGAGAGSTLPLAFDAATRRAMAGRSRQRSREPFCAGTTRPGPGRAGPTGSTRWCCAPASAGVRWRCCAPTPTTRRSSAVRSGASTWPEILLAHPAASRPWSSCSGPGSTRARRPRTGSAARSRHWPRRPR